MVSTNDERNMHDHINVVPRRSLDFGLQDGPILTDRGGYTTDMSTSLDEMLPESLANDSKRVV